MLCLDGSDHPLPCNSYLAFRTFRHPFNYINMPVLCYFYWISHAHSKACSGTSVHALWEWLCSSNPLSFIHLTLNLYASMPVSLYACCASVVVSFCWLSFAHSKACSDTLVHALCDGSVRSFDCISKVACAFLGIDYNIPL